MSEFNHFFVDEKFNIDVAGFMHCSCNNCIKNCGRKKSCDNDFDVADMHLCCSDYESNSDEGGNN